mmetsp:Transcript_1644/g.1847  ORF Transcript_1644/g.1847 Transcript_1644/m.1847 type:complete len:259 (+) Transcript_1644:66-842(+)
MESFKEKNIERHRRIRIMRPEGTPSGITVFIPGTNQKLDDYKTTCDALLNQNQIVFGVTCMNPFMPFNGRTHDQMAKDCRDAVKEFRKLDGNGNLPRKYNMVGHSLGGKVCLMMAAKFDPKNVNTIIALDPVDDKPQELTRPSQDVKDNLNEWADGTQIHLFQSEKGGDGFFAQKPNTVGAGFFAQVPEDKNASAINKLYGSKDTGASTRMMTHSTNIITSFAINEGAIHMSYRDTEMDDASVQTRKVIHAKIAQVIH